MERGQALEGSAEHGFCRAWVLPSMGLRVGHPFSGSSILLILILILILLLMMMIKQIIFYNIKGLKPLTALTTLLLFLLL